MKPEDVADKTLSWHKLAIAKLKANPELLDIVRENIASFKSGASPGARHYYVEWEEHLRRGFEHLCQVALEESEHADDLRQCSVFIRILTEEERLQHLRDWRAAYHKRLLAASRSIADGAEAQRDAIQRCREEGIFDGKAHLENSPIVKAFRAGFPKPNLDH